MKHFISLLMVVLCLNVHQLDAQSNQYLSIINDYEFRIPQLGVSIKLPAYFGFLVPELPKSFEKLTDIQDMHVNFFLNDTLINPLSSQESPILFRFKAPRTSETGIYFVAGKRSGDTPGIIWNQLKKEMPIEKKIPALKTWLGSFDGYRVRHEGNLTDVYLAYNDDYFFLFYLPAENPDLLKTYENVFKSLKKINDPNAIEIYKVKVNARDTEREVEAWEEYGDLHEFEKTIDSPMTLSFPGLGIDFRIPTGTSYNFQAKEIQELSDERGKNELKVKLDRVNAFAQYPLYFIRLKKGTLNMMIRFDRDVGDPKQEIQKFAETQNMIQPVAVSIGGIQAAAGAFGLESAPTVNAYAAFKNYGLCIMMYINSEEDLKNADNIIKSIAFSDVEKQGLPVAKQTLQSLVQQISIKERKVLKLPIVQFAAYNPQNFTESTLCTFPDMGFSVHFPASNDKIYPNPQEQAKYDPQKNVLAIFGVADEKKAYSISTFDEERNSITISIMHNDNRESVASYVNGMIVSWKTYNHIKVTNYGIGSANDGQEWGLMQYTSGAGDMNTTTQIYTTLHNDLLIMMVVTGSKTFLNQYESILQTIKIK